MFRPPAADPPRTLPPPPPVGWQRDREIGSGPCTSDGKSPQHLPRAGERIVSMRRYATSKVRIALLVTLVAAVVFIASSPGLAQGTPPAGGDAAPKVAKQGLMSLILSHIDFVSIIIG